MKRWFGRVGSPLSANTLTLPGPEDIARFVLSNGMVVLARSNFHTPSVVVSGYLCAGSIFDSDEKLGLSDFVTSALMRGTERRTFEQIYDSLESVGASWVFRQGRLRWGSWRAVS